MLEGDRSDVSPELPRYSPGERLIGCVTHLLAAYRPDIARRHLRAVDITGPL